jgi:hypothetical protein
MALCQWVSSITLLAAALALSACGSNPQTVPSLPPAVGNGHGSQYGNYAAQADGEFKGEHGERCVAFNWDRPIGDGKAIRIRSASCESAERPGFMICHDISRTVIPIAESNLATASE